MLVVGYTLNECHSNPLKPHPVANSSISKNPCPNKLTHICLQTHPIVQNHVILSHPMQGPPTHTPSANMHTNTTQNTPTHWVTHAHALTQSLVYTYLHIHTYVHVQTYLKTHPGGENAKHRTSRPPVYSRKYVLRRRAIILATPPPREWPTTKMEG